MNQIVNKRLLYFLINGIIVLFSACADYLDVSSETSQDLTTDKAFENPTYLRQWHNNLFNCISQYSSVGGGVSNGFTGVWCVLAGETTNSVSDNRHIMTSGFTANNATLHRWAALYKSIRSAMIFIERAHSLGGTEDQSQVTEEEVNRMKTEAKFLIAYSYFSLFELYGPVPIIPEIVDPEDKNPDYPRATVDEIVTYIDSMLNEIIQSNELPETLIKDNSATGNNRYNLNEIVRPTKLVAMALRAKLWVYAASPLFNGKYTEALQIKNVDGKQLFSPYDATKWNTAKKYVEEFLNFAHQNGMELYHAKPNQQGVIDPHLSVYEVFQIYNDEIIWATSENEYNSVGAKMEARTTPRDIYNAFGNVCVSQDIVDAFFMNNGLAIHDPGSGYREDGFCDVVNVCNDKKRVDHTIFNMYANREPRFYAAVIYQGKSWHIQPVNKPNYTFQCAKGEPNDNSKSESPRTGYLFGKFKNRQMLNTGSYLKNWGRPSILLRLADFYLYYAEVCNEINPADPNIIEYLDKVRERAGIPGYKELAATGKKNIIGNQELQRSAIRHERKVELLIEGQRYFDIRRWMICGAGEEADQSIMYGLNMNGKSTVPIGEFESFYRRVVLENRAWRRAMYLYPVPYNEIQKSRLLVQNPLW